MGIGGKDILWSRIMNDYVKIRWVVWNFLLVQ